MFSELKRLVELAMARRNIEINLFNPNSLKSAIQEIKKYRNDLPNKCEEICRKLSDIGMNTALSSINEVPQGKVITLKADIKPSSTGCKAILIATGKTVRSSDGRSFNLLFAIEFGAGIKYNSTSNPKSSEFGMGVGTFPGQTHAFDKNGWWYLGEDGEWHHSYGVKATMPMYKASLEIYKNVDKVVKEVFGN